ncbi:sigma-70 family RNA polymerase sigma factor [Pedobacter hiemivivus]|uniref:Sigma-70 family RNA polymerase sigma factor n=1 Tax=Pedobacter hiemivivus TaxID=2530454 RepID=A0A4R0NGW8_9SPHI|nr:sigma-70 family RNA polymerase sigma factor [Pedobacter hiemivivus]TCC98522.1 sigma-70 family RNA polymerase sigma factor [Pedobacter hiemivivus]
MSNYDFLSALKKGHTKALELLYKEYWEILYNDALIRTQNEDVAKDIVQEIFISIWEKRENLNVKESISGYLRQAVKYKVINFFRNELTADNYHEEMLFSQDVEVSSDQQLLTKELQQALNQAIDEMPAKMRLIFMLSRMEQKSIDEISLELGLHKQTIKNQLSIGVKVLKKRFSYILFLVLLLFC